ncbi:MAG: serine/threonine transporter SstT, partial [Schwartzia sp.]|nr:serine/threonine transporter SstT [Schwartzia sp. (in: firmicutes)]
MKDFYLRTAQGGLFVNPFIKWYAKKPLIGLIAGGLVVGIVLAIAVPKAIPLLAIFGKLFVGALKGIAPILVFVLVRNAMARDTSPENASMRPVIGLYMIGTFCAALVAVAASFLFPTELKLSVANANLTPPSGIIEVLKNLLLSVVDNPVNAIIKANYISILAWAILFGIALRKTSPATQSFIADVAEGVTKIVQWIIRFAPFGIMGLVADAIGESGLDALLGYARLLAVLLGAFFSVALIMNPLVVFLKTHKNPYPLVFTTLRESGVYAFFTRSSAAN